MRTIFVYGTLKQGHGNHPVIGRFEQTELVEERAVLRGYSMASLGGFPAIFPEKEGEVIGEVYKVPDEALGPLDRLEGYPSFYDRTQVWVEDVQGEEKAHYHAMVYFIDKGKLEGRYGGLERVEGGEW